MNYLVYQVLKSLIYFIEDLIMNKHGNCVPIFHHTAVLWYVCPQQMFDMHLCSFKWNSPLQYF